jgi:DNA-binding NarL/FixJ family response regulator
MNKIRLAIVDDYEMARKALIRLLNLDGDWEIVIEAENGIDLIEKLNQSIPDIILMDIQMPKMNGIEATERVLSQYPSIKIIAVTQFDNEQNIIEMYSRGVKSFLSKGCNPAEFFTAIRVVNQGGVYLTDEALKIIQSILGSNRYRQSHADVCNNLSDIEIQVLKCICKGLSSTDISKVINKSPRTVEKYREDLYRKFNVGSKKELIEIAISHELPTFWKK